MADEIRSCKDQELEEHKPEQSGSERGQADQR